VDVPTASRSGRQRMLRFCLRSVKISRSGLATRTGERATWPLFSWLSLVDGDIATREALARKAFNCRLSFSSTVQRYKAEAPRTSGALVRDDRRVNDRSERSEQFLKFCFRCIKGKISYKKFHKKDDLRECQLPEPFPRIGFQITNEELLTDDLPCYEQKTNDRATFNRYPEKIK
jgi:hypothetical protein